MTGGEQATNHVQENNVWPKPDYAAMIESGVDKKVAALIKIIRDRLAAEPKNDSTAERNNYVEVMTKLKSSRRSQERFRCKGFKGYNCL